MSCGPSPACSKAARPLVSAPVAAKSGMLIMPSCSLTSPLPSTWTGAFAILEARSALVTTSAPPPSVIRQQSLTRSGLETVGDERTSSTVMGLRRNAEGLSAAQRLAATATSASWSLVVPNWSMWRCAISA